MMSKLLNATRIQSTRIAKQIMLVLALTIPVLSMPLFSSDVQAQQPGVQRIPHGHNLQDSRMVPGQIGAQRMIVRDQLNAYMQPIQFVIPKGCEISIWNGESYQKMDSEKPLVRLLVGAVYRMKVTKIRRRPSKEVYPSIEIVNRLYPPQGQADQFPVMVHITEQELEKAVDGNFVHRVTYLENPETAVPFRQVKGDQNYFRVRQDQDPLKVAASLGKPMTIVRMGSRVPDMKGDGRFALGRQFPIQIVKAGSISQPAISTNTRRALGDGNVDLDKLPGIVSQSTAIQRQPAPRRLPITNSVTPMDLGSQTGNATMPNPMPQRLPSTMPKIVSGNQKMNPAQSSLKANQTTPVPSTQKQAIGDRETGQSIRVSQLPRKNEQQKPTRTIAPNTAQAFPTMVMPPMSGQIPRVKKSTLPKLDLTPGQAPQRR